jgi:putative addiction module component (TIGR02574 family)
MPAFLNSNPDAESLSALLDLSQPYVHKFISVRNSLTGVPEIHNHQSVKFGIRRPSFMRLGRLPGGAKMTETVERLKLELSQLSVKDRAELAYFLIHSLDEEVDYDVESAWDIQLTRRMQEINEGTAFGKPSHQVFTDLREKYL